MSRFIVTEMCRPVDGDYVVFRVFNTEKLDYANVVLVDSAPKTPEYIHSKFVELFQLMGEKKWKI